MIYLYRNGNVVAKASSVRELVKNCGRYVTLNYDNVVFWLKKNNYYIARRHSGEYSINLYEDDNFYHEMRFR